jgi:ubiquinone/menaquinone biosynthesis C-methylase UbiE
MSADERYVPAAGRTGLTALYDPLVALTMRERAFRRALIAAVLGGGRPRVVLDMGCGTGSVASRLAEADTQVQVLGVDGDEAVLALAREKCARFGERVRFTKGMAGALPMESASVDVAVASLLLHHLSPGAKRQALAEARRVLAPAGRLVIADWGRPQDPLAHAGFLMLRLLDGFANTADHAAGRLPSLLARAGFADVKVEQRWRTLWGSLELIVAERGGETSRPSVARRSLA